MTPPVLAVLMGAFITLPAHADNVLIVGDSIAIGIAQAWCTSHPEDRVTTIARVGARIAQVAELAERTDLGRPDRVVIQVGTNDAAGGRPDPVRVRGDASRLLTALSRAGAPIVCQETLSGTRPDLARGVPVVAGALRASCAARRAQWVPAFPGLERAPDEVHLTTTGYMWLASSLATHQEAGAGVLSHPEPGGGSPTTEYGRNPAVPPPPRGRVCCKDPYSWSPSAAGGAVACWLGPQDTRP